MTLSTFFIILKQSLINIVKPTLWTWKLWAQAAGHSHLASVLKVVWMPPFYQSLAAGGQER